MPTTTIMLRTSAAALAAGTTLCLALGADQLQDLARRPTIDRYSIRQVPVPAGSNSVGAADVNERGEAVGTASGQSGSLPLMYIDGEVATLDTLGGLYTNANAVNELGQIAGSSQSQPWWGWRAVRWELDGSMTVVPPLTGDPNDNTYGDGINRFGHMAGTSEVSGGFWHAFFWSEQTGTIDLGSLADSYSGANDVNDHGVVVGWSSGQMSFEMAFRWESGGVMTALPALKDSDFPGASASAINNHNVIVGHSNGITYGIQHAVMWDASGDIHALGSLGGHSSWAYDINDAGVIVGEALLPDGSRHAFIHRDGVMRDLNDFLPPGSPWTLLRADAISDDGRIVGVGHVAGETATFVLEPVRQRVLGGK